MGEPQNPTRIQQILGTAFPYSQYGPAGAAGSGVPVPPYDFWSTPAGQAAGALIQGQVASMPPGAQNPSLSQQALGTVFPYSQYGPAGVAGSGEAVPPYDFWSTPAGQAALALQQQGQAAAPPQTNTNPPGANVPVGVPNFSGEAGIAAVGAGEGSPLSLLSIPPPAPYDLQAAQAQTQRGEENLQNAAGNAWQLSKDTVGLVGDLARTRTDVDLASRALQGLGPAASEFAAGNAARGIGMGIRAPAEALYGAGKEYAGELYKGAEAIGSGGMEFLRGLTGSELSFAGASPPPQEGITGPGTGTWEAPPPAPPPEKSEFQLMLEMFMGDTLNDGAGERASASFSQGGSQRGGGSGGSGQTPTQAPVQGPLPPTQTDETLNRIQKRLDALAVHSTLPPETFKDRLTKMMVGIAIGYSNAYAQSPNFGRAGVAGLTGGIQNLVASDEQRRAEQTKLDEEYRDSLKTSLGVEMDLYNVQQREKSADRQAGLYAESIAQRREGAMMQANSRLAAAQIQAQRTRDPLERVRLFRDIFGLIKDKRDMEMAERQTVYDELEIDFGSGPTKIGELRGTMKAEAIAAYLAPQKDPENWSIARNSVEKEFADDAAMYQERGGDANEFLDAKARARIMQMYSRDQNRTEKIIQGGP